MYTVAPGRKQWGEFFIVKYCIHVQIQRFQYRKQATAEDDRNVGARAVGEGPVERSADIVQLAAKSGEEHLVGRTLLIFRYVFKHITVKCSVLARTKVVLAAVLQMLRREEAERLEQAVSWRVDRFGHDERPIDETPEGVQGVPVVDPCAPPTATAASSENVPGKIARRRKSSAAGASSSS